MTRQEAAVIARASKAAKEQMPGRFWAKVDMRSEDECWPWKAAPRRKDEGYGAFYFEGRQQPASKIAWILTNGRPVPDGLVVCHSCDNPPCCNPNHLWVGTRIDNDKDRIAKGRQCRGSQQKHAVLNESLVLRLRARADEIGLSKAAREFGINKGTAYTAYRRGWRHV